jgi:predicted DNA-binding protein
MHSQLTIRLPHDLSAAIAKLARSSGLKRADIVRAALREYLEHRSEISSSRPIDLVRDLLGRVRRPRSAAAAEARRVLVDRIRRHAVRPS